MKKKPISRVYTMERWVNENADRIYRFWVYKHTYTPLELRECYEDQTQFEDGYCSYGRIEEAIPIGTSDYLLGFRILEGGKEYGLEYHLLSNISLVYYESDNEQEGGDNDSDEA